MDYPNFYDRDLRRLFSDEPEYQQNPKASRVHPVDPPRRAPARRRVDRLVSVHDRSRDRGHDHARHELNLRLKYPQDRTKLDFTMLVTVQTMNYLHSGRHRVAL